MIETWVLILQLASGDVMVVPQTTELACDGERRAIVRATEGVCVEEGSQVPVAAQCFPAHVLNLGEDAE